MLQKNNDNIVILTDLPKTLFFEMDTPIKKPYPGVPDKWFPMRPTSVTWSLDAEENITIDRQCFPLKPEFSRTVDSATGQTLQSAIPYLGDEFDKSSQYAAMRCYISMSRVTKANDLLIAQPFNPLLFRMGLQAWPTLLLQVLQGNLVCWLSVCRLSGPRIQGPGAGRACATGYI